ncbi:C40 family peptidase [Mycobacterium sp. GA-2829]|uniref:C40 family peptidase n=1 Tax=Mycobacterium sp. GA-2829 TaxID=1772283 RepID=UPI00073FB0E9|nr:C40 family peptidase [Mycobacterium sp. GA-2829]KUI36234.1 glycoside hydrolase [Mycobacterium sp. GA-2829]
MSVDALLTEVSQVLGRSHALFGEPPASGGSAAALAGGNLAAAGDLVRSGGAQLSGLSGTFAADYKTFTGHAGPALDALAANDSRLGERLRDAAGSDRTGRTSSGTVITGAATDSAGLSPLSNTPAGQRALLVAMRNRIAQQQRVVAAYKVRDARMAVLLRSMAYARSGGGGAGTPIAALGGPVGAAPLSGGGGSLVPAPPPGPRGPLSRHVTEERAALAAQVDRRAGRVPAGPAADAVRAALSKQGVPYVWGAKGPNNFDCSGLTRWAWAQAGVQLGPDTYTQVGQGVPIAREDVRAGDLIFPKASWDSRGPGHVQLAISPTEVVHAPQTGDVVRIAPMPSAYVARRPVPDS